MSWPPTWAEEYPRWFKVLIRHQGVLDDGKPGWVEDDELAEAIREEPHIPDPELAELVAGRIDGSVSRPRGRPRVSGMGKDLRTIANGFFDEMRVGVRQAAFRRQGIKSPKEQAIRAEAKAQHKSPDTLKNQLREYRRVVQRHQTLIELAGTGQGVRPDWSDVVEQALAEGAGRLDPEKGFVWMDDGDGPLENPE